MAGKYERKRERRGISRKQVVTLVCTVLAPVISIAALHFYPDNSANNISMADSVSNSSINKVNVNVAKNESSSKTENLMNNNAENLIFSNAYINAYYRKCETEEYNDNIVFYVENNYDKSVMFNVKTVALDSQNIAVYSQPAMAAHSKGEISISSFNRLPTLNPQTITISCEIWDGNNYDTLAEFEAVDVNLASNSSSKQSSTSTSTSLTADATMSVISSGLGITNDISQDFMDLIDDIKKDPHFDQKRAQSYEQPWKEWADKTDTFLSNLSDYRPDDLLSDAWDNLILLVKEMNYVSHSLSNWDTNNDGQYLTDEMTDLVNGCREIIIESDKYLCAIEAGIQTYSDSLNTSSNKTTVVSGGYKASTDTTQSKNTSGTSSNKSTGTSKSNNTGTNKSSNSTKKSSNSSNQYSTTAGSHKCLECGKTATRSIVGISGQTEYYCTSCYNQMAELINKLFNGS